MECLGSWWRRRVRPHIQAERSVQAECKRDSCLTHARRLALLSCALPAWGVWASAKVSLQIPLHSQLPQTSLEAAGVLRIADWETNMFIFAGKKCLPSGTVRAVYLFFYMQIWFCRMFSHSVNVNFLRAGGKASAILEGPTQKVTVGFCCATSCSLLPQTIFDCLLLPTNMLPLIFLKNCMQAMNIKNNCYSWNQDTVQGEITACQKCRGRVST